MRLIAYTSVSHFGFIVLGIFAMTSAGQSGSTLYMVNHGFSTAALFLVAAMLIRPPRQQADPRLRRVAAGDPGPRRRRSSSPACPRWRCRACPRSSRSSSSSSGTFQRYRVAAVFATLGIILAALYILLMYQRMMTGPKPESAAGTRDLAHREKWVVAPLIALFLVLGFYPKPVLDVINPAVDQDDAAHERDRPRADPRRGS